MSDTCTTSFRFLQDLAADLTRGVIAFPTFHQATIRVRAALDQPDIDVERLSQAVATEPVLAARLVHMANSVGANAGGRTIGDLRTAILRVGLSVVRTVAIAVALEQLKNVGGSPQLRQFAASAWRHSVQVAALAQVLARRLTRLNPDEALFAGLVHDIGHFYLLSQIGRYPELEGDTDAVMHILAEWHPSIGQAVLHGFRVSDAVTEAVAEHENGRYRLPLRSIPDIVALANLASSHTNPVTAVSAVPPGKITDPEILAALADGQEEIVSLAAALRS